MFTTDAIIDAVQNGKKTFVKTFIQNETLAEAMNNFVDAQTVYTKESVKSISDINTTITKETLSILQNASKFDFEQFGVNIAKAFGSAK